MSATAANDEVVSFRIQDQNRSTFWVETRPKDYRVGVEVVGQGVNYFYFTPEQYKVFIHSEFKRVFK